MIRFMQARVKSEKGVTMIEYALLAALIAVFLILSIQGVAGKAKGTFDNIAAKM